MNAYVDVLRAPGAARPLAAALVARTPDSIAGLGIVVLVRATAGSYSAAGAAAGAFALGTAASAPAVGRAIDRAGQRAVLAALAAAFALALVTLVAAAGHGTGWTIALAALAGLTRPPLESSLRALWPRLVRREQLDTAYALDSTAQELIWIGGPLLFALLISLGSPSLPLLACAATTVAGTAVYATSPRVPRRAGGGGSALVGPLGLARLRALAAAGALYGIASGMLLVALTAAAAASGQRGGAGLLVAVWGLGSLAGGLAYGTIRWRAPVERRAGVALAAFAAALALLALAGSFASLAALMVVLGVPLSPWLGAFSACVERAVPDAMTAESFTWTFAAITVGAACGNALGGVLVEAGGSRAAFLTASAWAFAGAALAARRRGSRPERGERP